MANITLGLNQLQAVKYEYLIKHFCDWSFNPRPFSTIAVMQNGTGNFDAGNNSFVVDPGEAFFIPAGSKYVSYWAGKGNILYYAIHFNFENSYSEFSPQRFRLQKIEMLNSETFLNQFDNVRININVAGFNQLKAYSAFYSLYADILPLLKSEKANNTSIESILNAIEYIENNSEKNFSVASLAEICHLSESRFFSKFKKAMGCSPIAYRNNVRIRKSLTMLGADLGIDEIATNVGFSSAIHYRKVFRCLMGKLPSEYRNSLCF